MVTRTYSNTGDGEEQHSDTTDSDTGHARTPGARVGDREADAKHLRVVAYTPHTAENAHIAATGTTVADENPEYPSDDPVLVCVYENDLDEKFGDRWLDWPDSYLSFMIGNYGLQTYSFPESRLAPAPARDDSGE